MEEITIDAELREKLNKVALGCRVLAMEGHEDLSLGHLSLRDPDGRGVWMKRCFVGLDEIRGPDDFILLDYDGQKLYGPGERHSEWPIHTEILRARPDVAVVGHTHPFHASLLSATGETLQPIGLEGIHFALNTPHFTETVDLITDKRLGGNLAETLGNARMAFMKNHGVVFVGSNTGEAVITGVWLEKASRAQLALHGAGIPWSTPERADWEGKAGTIGSLGWWENFFAFYCRKLLRREGATAEAERMRAETLGWRRGEIPRW